MLTLSVGLVFFAASLLFVEFLKLQWKRRQLPPGPTPFPLFGNLLQMKFRIHHDILKKMRKLHGNIFTLWLANTPVIVLQGYQAVKEGMTAHAEEVAGRPQNLAFNMLTHGKGVMFSNGHLWKQQRRFGLVTMRKMGVGKKDQECQIQEEACRLVEYLRGTNGKPLDPTMPIIHAVSNVICALILGHRFSIEDENFHRLIEAVDDISAFMNSRWFYVHDQIPWFADRFLTPCKKTFSGVHFMRTLLAEEIERYKEKRKADENQNFIGYYLDQIAKTEGDADATYDKENLIQAVFDLFLAGTETTATTLRWALLYMVVYPDVQEKVQKELDAVLGSSNLPCYMDRKRLPYTNAVIHEIQRYSNIVLIALPRQTMKDTELLGYPIPKNTIVLVNIDSVLSDPEKWETPDQFNPGHFLDKDGNFVHREAFLPFSIGSRVCMGELLARLELFIVFSTLLRAFRFTLPDGVKEVNTKFVFGSTMRPPPYQLCAIPR
ncbi:cytochrome P450 2C25-like [Oxyura jamaicensis]|uniref:cytochrome P450 2C25-like n=1 Tax=Oxyura jamaicensis TaxID=8884 RepID=UPI0015A5D613|nr:cytochrome P450 2C25-like [Oxyura jamaicensis]